MPGRWVTVKGRAVYIEDGEPGERKVAVATMHGRPIGQRNYYAASRLRPNGQWISQGTYHDRREAEKAARGWLERATASKNRGDVRVTDESGNVVWRSGN